MRKLKAFFIFCFLLLLCSCKKEEKPKVVLNKDEELYLTYCANCHGNNLEGGFGPKLRKIGKKYNIKQLAKILEEGKGTMPSQSFIDPKDRKKLVEWLYRK